MSEHARDPKDGRRDQSPEAFAPLPADDEADIQRSGDPHGQRFSYTSIGTGRPGRALAARGGRPERGRHELRELEDDLSIGRETLAPSHASPVIEVRAIREGPGLEVATADVARTILSLGGGDQSASALKFIRH